MSQNAGPGLIFGCILDGKGNGEEVGWDRIRSHQPGDGLLWVHLDHNDEAAADWLHGESGVDPVLAESLLMDETRPRCAASHEGLLVILRGVNLNPGAEPDDMVSIRIWLEEHRVISIRRRRLMAVQDLRDHLAAGTGPRDAGEFLVDLADSLLSRISVSLENLDDAVDAIEDELLVESSLELRSRLGALRRQAVAFRRYLAPQRDAMARIPTEKVAWLTDLHRLRLRELADRVTRFVEDLDSARDRAAVTQDELNTRLSDQMNRTMYVLSIVAAIFLPLGFLTGLLGINVGGIPGTENPWAFLVVCLLSAGLAAFLLWLFRRKHWI